MSEIILLDTLLDEIESGELDIKDEDWFAIYPTKDHQETDKRWWCPGFELKAMIGLRRELDSRHLQTLWGK